MLAGYNSLWIEHPTAALLSSLNTCEIIVTHFVSTMRLKQFESAPKHGVWFGHKNFILLNIDGSDIKYRNLDHITPKVSISKISSDLLYEIYDGKLNYFWFKFLLVSKFLNSSIDKWMIRNWKQLAVNNVHQHPRGYHPFFLNM